MFLLVRHVLCGRLADVVLPRDTARTSKRRYLQPPQKPPLPNVTFYGSPYYGSFTDLSSTFPLSTRNPRKKLFIQLLCIHSIFCALIKIKALLTTLTRPHLQRSAVTSGSQKCHFENILCGNRKLVSLGNSERRIRTAPAGARAARAS